MPDQSPESPPLDPRERPRRFEQVRSAVRVRHYSYRTEQAYVDWVRRFVLYHGERHPRDMGADQVTAYLTHLARERGVWINGFGRGSVLQEEVNIRGGDEQSTVYMSGSAARGEAKQDREIDALARRRRQGFPS